MSEEKAKTESKSNRVALRSIVIETDVKKSVGASNAMEVGDNHAPASGGNILEPPYDRLTLMQLPENNSELGAVIDAMEINIDGLGGRLVLREDLREEIITRDAEKIKQERKDLRRFLQSINPKLSLTQLRRRMRNDKERTGDGYWELIPSVEDPSKITQINHIESHTVKLTKLDPSVIQVESVFLDAEDGEMFKKTFFRRFRKFVQIRNGKKVYFKEWGDPRVVDLRNGKAYKTIVEAKKADNSFKPEEHTATAILHFKIYSPRTPYGMPRYIGNLFSIYGNRAAEEINWNTFNSNNIPAMAVLVSGNAMLTDGTIKRMKDFSNKVMSRDQNMSKMLIIEAEPASESPIDTSNARIDIKPLTNSQHKDQLFQAYDENTCSKIRRAYRLPPILVGKSDDYSRATAETSKKLADEQVFAPERQGMDREITKLFNDMGYFYWEYRSYGPNVTDADTLIKTLNSTEKTGAITPNLGRVILGDVLNKDIPPYREDIGFDANIPFSLTMADRVKGSTLGGNPSTGVLAPNQGQIPAADNNQIQTPTGTTEQDVIKALNSVDPDLLEISIVEEWHKHLLEISGRD